LIQSGERPERQGELRRFDTMPVFGSQGMKKIERIAVAGNSGGKNPPGILGGFQRGLSHQLGQAQVGLQTSIVPMAVVASFLLA